MARGERFSEREEIIAELEKSMNGQTAGPICFVDKNRNYAFAKEGNTCILGVPGTGKSRRVIIPMILDFCQKKESFIVSDPKGEIYQKTICYAERTHDAYVINFRNLFRSRRWNPLEVIRKFYTSGDPEKKQIGVDMLDELSSALFTVTSAEDPFWQNAAKDVFQGLVLILLNYARKEEVTMDSVYRLLVDGDEVFCSSTYLKEFCLLMGRDAIASKLLSTFVEAPNETRLSIKSVLLRGLSMFTKSEALASMLGEDELHIEHFDGMSEKPVAIYICIPDENSNYDRLCGILIGQLLNHFVRTATEDCGGSLYRRMNVVLEELGNIGGSIKDLDHILSAGRSRNIRCHLVLQSYSQLEDIYGKAKATTITSNCDVTIAFRCTNWDTLHELSKKVGNKEVEINGMIKEEPVITETNLAAMEVGQCLIIIEGRLKYITVLPDYTKIFDCSDWEIPQKRPIRLEPYAAHFDIVTRVRELKKKKIQEIMRKKQENIQENKNTSDDLDIEKWYERKLRESNGE
ncbi:MAG: type IV secretory system conjugative DNA transfer family protein [Lachnospiraceae bacterium]|nr:type IV secretory system conjugative DNA transfer family protein [Lachnospiraceae bacterium]